MQQLLTRPVREYLPRNLPRAVRRLERTWLVIPSLGLLFTLVAASTLGVVAAGLAIGTALYALALITWGTEKVGLGTLAVAFAMAPSYKGLATSPSDAITPMDLTLALAFVLLAPTLIKRQVRLPALYVGGLALVFVFGVLGSLRSESVVSSFVTLAQFSATAGLLLVLIAALGPSRRLIGLLAWSFVGGQVVSTAVALIEGPAYEGRYDGLSHHPNAYAEGGLMAFALLLYLFHVSRKRSDRFLVLVAAAICVASVLMSGSRAATVVLGVLVVMVPFVEKSAIYATVGAAGGVLSAVALPFLVESEASGSSLDRLAGGGNAAGADAARATARETGIRLAQEHPLTGRGFVEVELIHDNFLAILAATGIVGLAGFILMMGTLARPILSQHPLRRLSYVAFAFIGLVPTVPSLDDRTLWLPLSLVILATLSPTSSPTGAGSDQTDDEQASPTPAPIAT